MRISIALLPKLFLKKDSELQSWIVSVAPLIVRRSVTMILGSARASRAPRELALTLVGEGGANEAAEERMRFVRFALEFRVILAGDKERMVA